MFTVLYGPSVKEGHFLNLKLSTMYKKYYKWLFFLLIPAQYMCAQKAPALIGFLGAVLSVLCMAGISAIYIVNRK